MSILSTFRYHLDDKFKFNLDVDSVALCAIGVLIIFPITVNVETLTESPITTSKYNALAALRVASRWEIATLAGAAGCVVKVALATGKLGWTAVKNIYLWYKGEVSGARCVKEVIDCSAELLGTLYGIAEGAAIGTVVFPLVGTVIGGIVGGFIGSALAGKISDYLTGKFFDLPKSVALENAYKLLGLTHSCSNGEINSAYHRLALKCHPDKGGTAEEWTALESAMALIRQARGEGI